MFILSSCVFKSKHFIIFLRLSLYRTCQPLKLFHSGDISLQNSFILQIRKLRLPNQQILGSKTIVADDCSHKIKRHLPLGRKAMINLDNILKSKDIILLTKVHRVKAMVFPVVMYGCESWTIKKAEGQRIDALELWC